MSVDYKQRSEKLRIRMSRLRCSLHGEVDEIVDRANDLLDWKYYLKHYPIASVSTIAAVAYLLVPRRKFETNNVKIDEEAIDRLLAARELNPPAPPPKPSLFSDLMGMATQMAFRTALTLATTKLLASTVQDQQEPQSRPSREPRPASYSTGVDNP